tara:strand:- start:2885 stop:3145 length:261 start_codon:yes stop_codon:yes gene_type:complete
MMYMSAENKEWMAHAIFLGEDNMHLFRESRWEWISEWETGVFYKAYVRFGGIVPYENDEALNCAIEYAEQKIEACFEEIRRRFNLG